jgi:hypothetical protein
MPIRINLLAEQQYAEEMRRRDPVKRGFQAGGILVGLLLLVSLAVQIKNWSVGAELHRLERQWRALENKTSLVKTNLKTIGDIDDKLARLHQLATNRFLWGPVLNALQFSAVEGIEVVHFKAAQSFALVPEVKGKDKTKPSPALSTEKTILTIDAKYFGTEADDKIDQFRKNLRHNEYLKTYFTNDNLIELKSQAPPQQDPVDPAKSFVAFSLECRFPEVTRQ